MGPGDPQPSSSAGSATAAEPRWHGMETDAVLQALGVDGSAGLNEEDVKRRLEAHGYNELETARAASPLVLFLRQFRNVLILLLLGAAGLSAAIGELVDAIIVLIIVAFSAVLGFMSRSTAPSARSRP